MCISGVTIATFKASRVHFAVFKRPGPFSLLLNQVWMQSVEGNFPAKKSSQCFSDAQTTMKSSVTCALCFPIASCFDEK